MRRLRVARLAALWAATVLVLIVSEACGPDPAASVIRIGRPVTLAGTTWQLASIGGTVVPAGTVATLSFGPTDVSGESTCNTFGGTYAYDPATGALRIGGLVSTKRACLDPGFNGLESALFAALRGVATASIDPAGRLVLGGTAGELVFVVGPVRVGPGVTGEPATSGQSGPPTGSGGP